MKMNTDKNNKRRFTYREDDRSSIIKKQNVNRAAEY